MLVTLPPLHNTSFHKRAVGLEFAQPDPKRQRVAPVEDNTLTTGAWPCQPPNPQPFVAPATAACFLPDRAPFPAAPTQLVRWENPGGYTLPMQQPDLTPAAPLFMGKKRKFDTFPEGMGYDSTFSIVPHAVSPHKKLMVTEPEIRPSRSSFRSVLNSIPRAMIPHFADISRALIPYDPRYAHDAPSDPRVEELPSDDEMEC
eukprot:CAMPEP_0177648740 /NCGR_PEP_ID=MMETSP0447-20121125/10991_1 /TAXON_ID=0 /ORGANISM="Stygamoeba regulata, Strain BSH-02190019" /LENGTH=200 /DNA_ID=CAMNT_0019151405 /DNA_START=184 /DNA_END=786 /DNA_ORIENTATION=-